MNNKLRSIISVTTALLFLILVFMNFIGYWSANSFIQILFFFIMVISIFNAGFEICKYQKLKS
ncbi:hypothetical protein AN957_23670 [Cytobacillus solani]|uniref:Uncharacterized protein n=1 Tax=Cytobacillus solani TaxID=1637975 RepID=A0A0Q3QSY8_9BACI|nr:hypothetical protein AMS60_22760 [Bacillus sp. FJAT-21945]KQL21265.1 hypothetical protein AN957_23670 [Cytobacillus solani]